MELTFSIDPGVMQWGLHLLFMAVTGGCCWSFKGKFKSK